MYCNFVHFTVVDIAVMYYAVIVSNVNKKKKKNGQFHGSFPSKFRWKAIGFALI